MLSAQGLTEIMAKYTPFIMSRGMRFGHKGEHLVDFLAQVAFELWRDRASWPDDVKSMMALVRKHADATAIDMLRARKAQKRAAPTESLTMHDGSDPANTYAALHVAPPQEDLLDLIRIRRAIYIVAASLTPELERIVLARLNNDGGELFSKDENQRALRAFRKALSLPPESPKDAGVSDPAEHLVRTAKALEAESAKRASAKNCLDTTQEITCADVIWTNSRESGNKSLELRGMSGSGPSPTRTLWSATAAAINTARTSESEIPSESEFSPRSLPPKNGSGRSRRLGLSGSISTLNARRPEPTLVTRHEMQEESSDSRSWG